MNDLSDLVGKKILRVYMNEKYLRFDTDAGAFTYTVEGDCCSRSKFYDFVGVRKLLNNGPVTAVREINLDPAQDLLSAHDYKRKADEYLEDSIQVYGFAITTESKYYGEMTSVFSFRNYSNGYYGGWMEKAENREVQPEIKDDVAETVPFSSAA